MKLTTHEVCSNELEGEVDQTKQTSYSIELEPHVLINTCGCSAPCATQQETESFTEKIKLLRTSGNAGADVRNVDIHVTEPCE